jgi:hypothetical protein
MDRTMGEPQTINCGDFWNALVLKSILEDRGVVVHPAQENVFLTLTVSGPLDVIETAIGELKGKYRGCWPIRIEGTEPAPPSANGAYAPDADLPPHIEGTEPVPAAPPSTNDAYAPDAKTLPSPAPQRCASTTSAGSQCRLPAVPGGTKCAIHASTREDWHRVLRQP